MQFIIPGLSIECRWAFIFYTYAIPSSGSIFLQINVRFWMLLDFHYNEANNIPLLGWVSSDFICCLISHITKVNCVSVIPGFPWVMIVFQHKAITFRQQQASSSLWLGAYHCYLLRIDNNVETILDRMRVKWYCL